MGESWRKERVKYDPVQVEEIVARIAEGEAWSRICREEGKPSYSTLYAWAKKKPALAERLAQARLMAADWKADEALELLREHGTVAQQANLMMTQAARMARARWGVNGGAEPVTTERPVVLQVVRHEKVTLADGTVTTRKVPRRRARA